MLQCSRQRDRVIRAPDLQFGGPEFKSRSDRKLDLFQILDHACKLLTGFASGQLEFLTLLSLI